MFPVVGIFGFGPWGIPPLGASNPSPPGASALSAGDPLWWWWGPGAVGPPEIVTVILPLVLAMSDEGEG